MRAWRSRRIGNDSNWLEAREAAVRRELVAAPRQHSERLVSGVDARPRCRARQRTRRGSVKVRAGKRIHYREQGCRFSRAQRNPWLSAESRLDQARKLQHPADCTVTAIELRANRRVGCRFGGGVSADSLEARLVAMATRRPTSQPRHQRQLIDAQLAAGGNMIHLDRDLGHDLVRVGAEIEQVRLVPGSRAARQSKTE